jgi:hypothetical protein
VGVTIGVKEREKIVEGDHGLMVELLKIFIKFDKSNAPEGFS